MNIFNVFSKCKDFEEANKILVDTVQTQNVEIMRLNMISEALKQQVEATPKASLADLMRENLGLAPTSLIDLVNQTDGKPEHYLAQYSEKERLEHITQLASVLRIPAFKDMITYLINCQGNYSMRLATDDIQFWSGRFSINGIGMVMREIKNAESEYLASREEELEDKEPDPNEPNEVLE